MKKRVSRSRFSQVKQKFELTKMVAAYIAAEKKIITESTSGMADGMTFSDGSQIIHVSDWTSPQEFKYDGFGNPTNETERYKQLLLQQAAEIRAQLERAIAEERFEDCGELEKTLNDIKKRYDSLD